jgi:hypothetical protein
MTSTVQCTESSLGCELIGWCARGCPLLVPEGPFLAVCSPVPEQYVN